MCSICLLPSRRRDSVDRGSGRGPENTYTSDVPQGECPSDVKTVPTLTGLTYGLGGSSVLQVPTCPRHVPSFSGRVSSSTSTDDLGRRV